MNADPSVLKIAPHRARPALLGTTERFRPGDRHRVEQVIQDLKRLGLNALRVPMAWEDCQEPGGQDWYGWLLPRIAEDLDLLPCFTYPAHPSLASHGGKGCADFLDHVVERHGAYFEWVELWCEPIDRNDWGWYLDTDCARACAIVSAAARRARQRGKKTVLTSQCPAHIDWLRLNCERGILDHFDAVGLRGSGEGSDCRGSDWQEMIGAVRGVLDRFDRDPELWITEVGSPSWPCDGMGQIDALLAALDAPAQRVYWCRYQDDAGNAPELSVGKEAWHGRAGLMTADGRPKLLSRLLLKGGIEGTRMLRRRVTVPADLRAPRVTRIGFGRKRAVITGGAGFVGVNLANRLAEAGHQVLVFDNLSRPGVEENLTWLLDRHGGRVAAEIADVRDVHAAREAVRQADRLFHFAAQVAVTTSLCAPVEDFEINARGTLNLLEAMRAADHPPGLIYTSSNKVYGALPDIALEEEARRYVPTDPAIAARGIAESRPLDFHSPYGCSKGAADQYVVDYARTYDLPAVVFRMSCIYGPHQRGTEDQGWVAHFLIQALEGREITIYGDGKQVRDILFVDDLVEAMLVAQRHMPQIRARAFNIGGGPSNTISLLELIDLIRRISPKQPTISYGPIRPGDQLYYVSDTGRFRDATGWQPTVSWETGVTRLLKWLGGAREDRLAVPQYERSAS